jgi:hypothetical protein
LTASFLAGAVFLPRVLVGVDGDLDCVVGDLDWAWVTVAFFAAGFRVETFLVGAAVFFAALAGRVLRVAPAFFAEVLFEAGLAPPVRLVALAFDVPVFWAAVFWAAAFWVEDFFVEAVLDVLLDVVPDVAAWAVVFLAVERAMARGPLRDKANRVASATRRAERICLACASGNRPADPVRRAVGPLPGRTLRNAAETGMIPPGGSGRIGVTARRRRAE